MGEICLPVPEADRVVWYVGSLLLVAWTIFAHHHGGYSWRLCPADEDLTEECFQRYPLRLLGSQTTVQLTNDTKQKVDILRTDEGTARAFSQWTRNPFPRAKDVPGFPFPSPGLKSDFCDYSLVDKVMVPNLPARDWVLGWRLDCEESTQVWQGCADIKIAASEALI